jgi:hypothetical protein
MITRMHPAKPQVEGPRADRFRRFMIFLNGYAASLKFFPRRGPEPTSGDSVRMADGRAFSMRDDLERMELRAELEKRIAIAQKSRAVLTQSPGQR